MSSLRALVLLASTVQIAAGSIIGHRLLQEGGSNVLGLILCCLLLVTGLASVSGLLAKPRPSLSRATTVKLNMLLFTMVLLAAGLYGFFEYKSGVTIERLQLMGAIAGAVALPFLINGAALGMIERKAKKPA